MKGAVLRTLICSLIVQLATAAYPEYDETNCPICYNPNLNPPAECTNDELDQDRTQACEGEEKCYMNKLSGDESPYANKNYHKGFNAHFWCTTAEEFGQFKSGVLFDGVGRNAALTTVPATTTSVETTAAEETPTKDTQDFVSNFESTDASASEATTEADGTVLPDPICKAGQQRADGACAPCPVKTYKEEEGDEQCTACPGDKTTIGTGSTSVTDCLALCGKGQRLGKDKECKYCQVNTYNDNENHFDSKCKACPEGKTSVMGAESESDCTLKTCGPGNYLTEELSCQSCGENTFVADEDHTKTECEPCPEGQIAATGSNECKAKESDKETPEESGVGKATDAKFLLFGLMLVLLARF